MLFYLIGPIFLTLSLVNIDYCLCTTSRTIPEYLRNCYRSGKTEVNAPHNVQLLVELVNKLENTNYNYNIRTLSSSLLHSLRLDGVERAPNIRETDYVIPYQASAFQFTKLSFILDLLIPGESLTTIGENLSETELCTLHFLISSTVDPWERGDETFVCPLSINSDTPVYQFIPFVKFEVNRTNVPASRSRCPIENGIVQTSWGNISPGTLIAGISAALEPQNVKVHDILLMQEVGETKIDKTLSNHDAEIHNKTTFEKFTRDFKKQLMSSTNVISNILAATLAGDIAELAIRQGPFAGTFIEEYTVGTFGKWNDTLVPRYYYIMEAKYGQWEITDAEILAGIDGYIIANYINEWITQHNRIRLSQIIEMYYSSYGVPMSSGVRACNRKQNMMKLFKEVDIYEQTLNIVNVMWFSLGTVFITPAEIANISNAAVKAFENYWPTLVDRLPNCDIRGDTYPMDVILATDGTWTKYQTEEFVAILSETLDVSAHGSSLGLMHGNSAEWISPPTHSILELFDNIDNSSNIWPNRLNLPAVLTSVITYLENKTELERNISKIAGLPHVIILAAPSTTWSEADLARSLTIMESLRNAFTDVYILYITPDASGTKKLSIDPRTYSDILIETRSTNVQEIAEMIRLNFISKTIPKRLISPNCDSEAANNVRLQHEDYINVGQKITYRIHPSYLMYVPVVKVQFQGTDQGDFSVCLSRVYSEDAILSCKLVTGLNDATFQIIHPCQGDAFCDPIYFIVKARATLMKCGDNDCRYPDQIRFIVRHEGIQCQNANNNGSPDEKNKFNRGFVLLSIFINFIVCLYI